MMVKNLAENLENKKKYLFLSINSESLQYIEGTKYKIPKEELEKSKEWSIIKSSVYHKVILGVPLLQLTSFECSGFFDEKFDMVFSFGMHYLLQKEYFVYDPDGLKKEEMTPMENLMKKVIRRMGKFEYGDQLLVKELELNEASGIMFFTREAKANLKKARLDKKIMRFDLIKERSVSSCNFEEFDKKIQNGKVREFEWN
jgi:hypothetical protein